MAGANCGMPLDFLGGGVLHATPEMSDKLVVSLFRQRGR